MPAPLVREPLLADDIALLQEIFDEACDGHRIPKTSEDAEALALILVQQMQKGRRDKATLRLVVKISSKNAEAATPARLSEGIPWYLRRTR